MIDLCDGPPRALDRPSTGALSDRTILRHRHPCPECSGDVSPGSELGEGRLRNPGLPHAAQEPSVFQQLDMGGPCHQRAGDSLITMSH
jgi:hypothetical protein